MSRGELLTRARHALGMSQKEFGPALGASHRTASRWDSGRSSPSGSELTKLAQLLVPVNLELATQAAAYVGDTLEGLGLVAPAPPPPPAIRATLQDLVEIVVCAVADQAGAAPQTVRPLLHTAFKRTRELGLPMEVLEQALAPSTGAAASKHTPGKARADERG